MPHGFQFLTFSKVAISGSAFEAVSPVSGDSATFFNVPQDSQAYLGEIWATNNLHGCEVSITASRFHDQVYGIRGEVTSGATTAPINRAVCISSIGLDQKIYPSDVLSVQVNGTASDDVVITMLIYYENLPGISARLASYDYVKNNMKNLVGINVALTPGDGVYGTGLALNSSDNRLHANTDYALLGATSQLAFAGLRFSGIDTGNLQVGGPILADPALDGTMFVRYARDYNQALIPIINSNNAGSLTLTSIGTDVGAAAVDVMLAELKAPFAG